jgi:hypothetical protein
MAEEVQQKIEKKEAKTPVFSTRWGSIGLAVWENKIKRGSKEVPIYQFTMQRNYKDANGKWHNTQSYRHSDVNDIKMAVTEFFEWYRKKRTQEQNEE